MDAADVPAFVLTDAEAVSLAACRSLARGDSGLPTADVAKTMDKQVAPANSLVTVMDEGI
jgi:hypothetical protein